MTRPGAVAAALAALAVLAAAAAPAAAAVVTPASAVAAAPLRMAAGPTVAFTLRDPRIAESSGMVASPGHPGIVWTHNDSGDTARIFAVNERTGRTVATYRLAGLVPRDWEAIAAGRDPRGRPALFIADIGDNSATRDRGVLVHRVPEPTRLHNGTLRPVSFRLRYPGSPVDAETLMVQPGTQRVFIVTKELFGGSVYAAPARLTAGRPAVLARVRGAPGLVTDGTFLPDGRYVLRDYDSVYVYTAGGRLQTSETLPREQQGESLALTTDRGAVLVGSEGAHAPVWRVPLAVLAASPGRTPTGGAVSAGPGAHTAGTPGRAWWLGAAVALRAVGAALVVAAAAGAVVRSRRRRR